MIMPSPFRSLALCAAALITASLTVPLSIRAEVALRADGDEYLFLLKGRGNVFWKVVRQGIEETAKSGGIHATVLHTDDDQTPEAQLNMCLAAIPRHPKVIVMGAHTRTVGIECFKQAAAAGIKVADIDGNVTVEDAKREGLHLSFSVGSDNSAIGKQAAEYLAKSTNVTTATRVLVIKGLPGSIVSEQRANGFLELVKTSMPQAVIVGIPAGNWDRMKAMNTAIDFMQREPKLDVIFSVSDVMTMGVVEGVKVAGKTGRVRVLSVDGIADARAAVLDGRMDANIAQLPYLMGKRAVELALKAGVESIVDVNEFTPTPLLTKETLSKHEDSNLSYLR